MTKDYSPTSDFLKRVFSVTLHNLELRAFPNQAGQPGAAAAFLDNCDSPDVFCERKDKDGFGVFFGVCTRRMGATSGNLESVVECPALWVDIDCVKQGLTGKETLDALSFLPFPPSITVNSGMGIHAYWLLEEAVDITVLSDGREQVERALKQLAYVMAGDTKATDLPRVMRLPGTNNTKPETLEKYGGAAPCHVIEDNGRSYDFAELVEWLEGQRPVLTSKAEPKPVRPVKEDDPFVAYAKEAGYKLAIDIEAELATMEHGAAGENSIHQTQLRVSMSMIARKYTDDEIVSLIIAATERAAPRDKQWNWRSEERAIRKMIASGRPKVDQKKTADGGDRESPKPLENPPKIEQKAPIENQSTKTELRVVSSQELPETKTAPKNKTALLGEAVLSVWRKEHGPVLLANGNAYRYTEGVWELWNDTDDQALDIMFQNACESLGIEAKPSQITASKTYFMNRPSLYEPGVAFDAHGLIICEDGTYNIETGEIGAHSPGHRASYKIGGKLSGSRDIAVLMQFLNDSFADKSDEDREGIIQMLQEWFGAALVRVKPRALYKGLLVKGGSRTGKTQLSEVLRAFLGGDKTSSASVGGLGDKFGLEHFLDKRGWVADDAIRVGEALDPEIYKKIITREEFSVSRKNKSDVRARFGFPVMLTSNALPRVNDQSEAVYNRSFVLNMTNHRPESMAEPIGYNSIAEKIIAEEMTGLTFWAIEGWKRLIARGTFLEPQCVKDAVQSLADSNNRVGAWVKEAIEINPDYKVASTDLYAAFADWLWAEDGEGTRLKFTQNGMSRRLREMFPQLGTLTQGVRYFTGLKLTKEGLRQWQATKDREGPFVPRTKTAYEDAVNLPFSIAKSEAAKRGITNRNEGDPVF